MTAQDVQIVLGNAAQSKIFVDSSTDGVWSGNIGLDSISSQSLGILIPNMPLAWYQAEYAAGCMAWRIQNAQTLQQIRMGFGVKGGLNETSPDMMAPMLVNPNDIVSFHPLAPATVGNSAALGWVYTNRGVELFSNAAIPDSVGTSFKSAVNDQSLGDLLFGSILTKLCIQLQDGATLTDAFITDETGGVQMTLKGAKRAVAGGQSNLYNLEVDGLAVAIGKGWDLKLTCTSA